MLTVHLEDQNTQGIRFPYEYFRTMNKHNIMEERCSNKCEDSCTVECQSKGAGYPPQVPPDSGIDFSEAEELCGVAEGVIREEINLRFRRGECPSKPRCFEWLAQCIKSKSSETSKVSAENIICYNFDRIEDWIHDMVCRLTGYMVNNCLKSSGFRPIGPLGPFLRHLITYNVSLIAYSYLMMHERAHCADIDDEGEATAYALYHTFINLIMKKRSRIGKFPLILVPLDGMNHYKTFIITFLTRYLTIYEIARQAYRMPGYWNYVQKLKLPLVMPKCSIPWYIGLDYYKGNIYYIIEVRSYSDHIHIHVSGDVPIDYLGSNPSLTIGELSEVWKNCEKKVTGIPNFPQPSAQMTYRCP